MGNTACTGIDDEVEAFINKWQASVEGERPTAQSFLNELCELLGVEKPTDKVGGYNPRDYMYERPVERAHPNNSKTTYYIDLYKRDRFVLEAKQSKKQHQVAQQTDLWVESADATTSRSTRGRGWDTLMQRAREQAESYAKRLPAEEGWPPFLIVVDIGRVFELYADFSLQGRNYAQFPDRQSYRISLDDLRRSEVRERLHHVWENPDALNPARQSAEVTRDIAEQLAVLTKRLEKRLLKETAERRDSEPDAVDRRAIAEKVSLFLIRCIFTMFAEDVGLLAHDSFTKVLKSYAGKAEHLHEKLRDLWRTMDRGGWSSAIDADIKRFNGKLFKNAEALPLIEEERELLLRAAKRNWRQVEPAIFGTLLERALDDAERHKLGAHYTPRAYVERLVTATVIDPLLDDWRIARAAAKGHLKAGTKQGGDPYEPARRVVREFQKSLCKVKVLDPACGTGNFLYVALELMKRLEGQVLEFLEQLGEQQDSLELEGHRVAPHQFIGLDVNPRAIPVAELVLWIGYLQWHFRTYGNATIAEPIMTDFRNIREQDAILAYAKRELRVDDAGLPITMWDGITRKPHPITGESVPDEEARTECYLYKGPKPAAWPDADFIVGNPPFIGGKNLRQELGEGYAEACWKARPHIPGGADLVMHFWDEAARLVRAGKARRFGFITTNSVTQKFSRRVIEHHLGQKKPLSLALAIPDHPWVKGPQRAAVRIAMTVGVAGEGQGTLQSVTRESALHTDTPEIMFERERGKIWANFTIGADLASAKPLNANSGLCSRGVALHGAGFIVTPQQAKALGLGKLPGLENHILPYRNGRDLTARPRDVMVIDLFPLSAEEARDRFSDTYQWVLDRVKPERDHNKRASYRDNWWIFGEPRRDFRPALAKIPRYIATVETSKHRLFQFLDGSIRPDNKLNAVGISDPFYLGVLSSKIHIAWSLASGGRLGVGNDPVYVKTRCFDPFPFPTKRGSSAERVARLAEKLDVHRKEILARHQHLTMTMLYNVLEKTRAGAGMTDAEKDIYQAGQVGILRDLHDALDAAVAKAYGWPADLCDGDILERLVALNHQRAAEERRGQIRWLRPDFQAPRARPTERAKETLDMPLPVAAKNASKPPLPKELPDQFRAVRAMMARAEERHTAYSLARRFKQGKRVEKTVGGILGVLSEQGQIDVIDGTSQEDHGPSYVIN